MHLLSSSAVVATLALWTPRLVAAPATPNDLRWGDAVGGLHMAVSVEPQAGFIYCWLRNASTNEISYNRCFLGSWEAVGIEYHDGTDWRRLARAAAGWRYAEGIGPTPQQLERLPPLQVITNCPHGICWEDTRFGPSIAITNGGRVGSTRQPRTDLSCPSSLGATFTIDIGDFEWPTGALASASQIRVFQQLSGPGHDAPITIRSLPVRLEGGTVRDFLVRLRHDRK